MQSDHPIIGADPRNNRQGRIMEAAPQLLISLRAYTWEGRYVGGFLRSVISDNLFEACSQADRASMSVLAPLANYCFYDMPGQARGDIDAYQSWRDDDGLVGLHGEEEASEYAKALGI